MDSFKMQRSPLVLLLLLLCCYLSGGRANRVYIHPFNLFAADNVSCETLQNRTAKPVDTVSKDPVNMAVLTPDERDPSERDNRTQDVTQRTAVLAELLNSLGLRMYQALSGKRRGANTLFSPVSTYGSLVTFDLGASKKTARSFQDLLGLSSGTDREDCVSLVDGRKVLKTLHRINSPVDDGPEDEITTQVWLFTRPHVRLSQDVVQGASDFTDSFFVRGVEFSKDEELEQLINAFVEKTSGGKVKDAFGDVDVNFNLLFVTSFNFHGNWKSTFRPEKTSLQEFLVDETTTVMTPVMTHTGLYHYYDDKMRRCTVVKLSLSKHAYMLVVLPHDGASLHDIEARLRTDVISSWYRNLHQGLLELSLPRFSASSANDVRDLLRNMDPEVESRLLGSQAEFSQLANTRTLNIDKAVNVVSFEMSEEGAVSQDEEEEAGVAVKVSINKPFFFSVMEGDSHAMLMLGKITNPTL
ncbi:angiotensinogen [Dunckerocampus dactyliophorus]|uniref:angiotensinogen n=1 Tax=Dunckerocampus dactyliophorus TaxID=161453 RepID=UPI002405CBE6|nr:angiotensinogen [Dunckerocampus dactyliophorus]